MFVSGILRSAPWQYAFGLLILANFVVNIGQVRTPPPAGALRPAARRRGARRTKVRV